MLNNVNMSQVWKILICFLIVVTSCFGDDRVLNLSDLVDEAIENHPQILKVKSESEAASEVSSRVGSLPDPMFQLTAQNFSTSDFSYNSSPMSALGLGLVQNLPYPGKLARRSQIAEDKASTSSEKERLMKAVVIFRVKQAYWNLHFTERALFITQENLKIIDVLTDVAINRLKVAQVAQQDALQAQVEHSKLRAQLTTRVENLENAKRSLNRAIGRSPEVLLTETAEPPLSDIAIIASNSEAHLLSYSPYIKVSTLMVRTGESSLAEARFDRRPDFKFGINYKIRDSIPNDITNGSDMISATFGVTLPLWMGKKQNARISETAHKLSAAKAQKTDVILEVTTRHNKLLETVLRLNHEIRLYQDEVLPRADEALNASISDYKSAKVGFVSVVQNWNTDLDLQIHYERLLKQRAVTQAEIQLVTGESLRRLNL